jgi:hypothetical protein
MKASKLPQNLSTYTKIGIRPSTNDFSFSLQPLVRIPSISKSPQLSEEPNGASLTISEDQISVSDSPVTVVFL